ncbi:MAG: ABC transporter ATP-binding protein [Pseudomonadota bacterium]
MALLDQIISRESRENYRRLLLDGARQHWKGYAMAIGLLLVVSWSTAMMAYIMKDVVNELVDNEDAVLVAWIAAAVTGLFLVRGFATYLNAVILMRIGNKIVARLQERLFNHLLQQDTEFYDQHSLGDVMIRFNGTANAARAAIELLIVSLGRDLVSLIGLIVVMFIQDFYLSLIVLLIGPLAALAVGWLTKRVKEIAYRMLTATVRITDGVKEIFLGARIVKAFKLEDHMYEKMSSLVHDVRRLSDDAIKYQTATVPMMDILGGLAVGSVIAYAGWQVATGSQDLGTIVSFIAALLMAYEPARRLARFQVQLNTHMVGVEIMYTFLDSPAGSPPQQGAAPLAPGPRAIALKDVVFAYGETPALNGLSIACPAGKVTALVGASGAGKSTVFDLIERFRSPQSGTVEIDGRDIADTNLADLRDVIAMVNQQTYLFSGSIRENIRFGRLNATDAEVEAAARAANAHEFIAARPGGYDSEIANDGSGLSGGERQRIAIARAILRDAPILLLDEATSALDAETEARIQEAFARLMKGRTTLVIAHRLATVRNAHVIHVLDRGKLLESGTHDQLIERGGHYAYLYDLQFREPDTGAETEKTSKETLS